MKTLLAMFVIAMFAQGALAQDEYDPHTLVLHYAHHEGMIHSSGAKIKQIKLPRANLYECEKSAEAILRGPTGWKLESWSCEVTK